MFVAWTTTHDRVSESGVVAHSCARRMCANSPDVHRRGSSRQSSEDGIVSRDMADREGSVVPRRQLQMRLARPREREDQSSHFRSLYDAQSTQLYK